MKFPNSAWNDLLQKQNDATKASKVFCDDLAKLILAEYPDVEESEFIIIDGEEAPKTTHEGELMCAGYYTNIENEAAFVELLESVSISKDTIVIVAGKDA